MLHFTNSSPTLDDPEPCPSVAGSMSSCSHTKISRHGSTHESSIQLKLDFRVLRNSPFSEPPQTGPCPNLQATLNVLHGSFQA